MSYGNGAQYDKSDNVVFFSPRGKDKDGNKVAPHFEVAKLVGEKIEKTAETATEISGNLIKVKVEDREIKGVKNKYASLYLKDNERKELYILNLSFRIDSRSLFNGLVNLDDLFDNITISTYANKKGYSSFSLKQNGTRVNWKYNMEELPQPESVMFKGKEMKDYSNVDDFLAKELNQLQERLSGKKIEAPLPEVPTTDKVTEDVPF